MGLNIVVASSTFFRRMAVTLPLIALAACAGTKDAYVSPADRVANHTFRYDCCDPGLSVDTKWWCDRAIKNPDHVLKDTDGNRYEYIWSDCEIGKEPWRKYEN